MYNKQQFDSDLENNTLLKELLDMLSKYEGKKITKRMETFLQENWKKHSAYIRFSYSVDKKLYGVDIELYDKNNSNNKKKFTIFYSFSEEPIFNIEKVYTKHCIAYGIGAEQRMLTWINWNESKVDNIFEYATTENKIKEMQEEIKKMELRLSEINNEFVQDCNNTKSKWI